LIRSGLVLIICTAALTAMSMGVEFSERPGTTTGSWMLRLYDTIGLFVLGGLDLGEPIKGTPLARALMWFAYFGAPAITGVAVVETVLRTVAPGHWQFRKIRGHIIIIGSGRLAELYLLRLRQLHPHKPVIVVEPDKDLVEGSVMSVPGGPIFVHGDLHSDLLIDRLRVHRAERVCVATSDDFLNLDTATRLLTRAPTLGRDIIVHVADLSLLRAVESTRVARECTIINSFHVAATHLVQSELLQWFQHTIEDDIVVLGGFGRFGQTVLAELQEHAGDRFNQVIIIDRHVEEMAAVFEEQVGFDNDAYEHHLISGDIVSPLVWKEIEERFQLKDHTPAFVMGCGTDASNIRTALQVVRTYEKTRAFARVSDHSSFAEDMASDTGVRIVSMADLVADSMPPSWFGR
jgi:hypothetical protein